MRQIFLKINLNYYLHQVANETKEKEDFGKYICENYQIPVIKNGDQVMSFEEFCKRIKGQEIKSRSITTNER